MGYGATINFGIPSLQADPSPILGGDLDAANYDILHVGVLTLGAITLNNVALVADLGTYRHSSSEGVRLEGMIGRLTLDGSGALLEKLDIYGHPVATLSLQETVRLQGPDEVSLFAGEEMILSGHGGMSYLYLDREVHLVSEGAVKITGLHSGPVEMLSHYDGLHDTTAVLAIQGDDDLLVARLTLDTAGHATFDSLKGGLIPPRYTTTQITSILNAGTPPAGFLVFNTSLGMFQYHTGTAIKTVTAS